LDSFRTWSLRAHFPKGSIPTQDRAHSIHCFLVLCSNPWTTAMGKNLSLHQWFCRNNKEILPQAHPLREYSWVLEKKFYSESKTAKNNQFRWKNPLNWSMASELHSKQIQSRHVFVLRLIVHHLRIGIVFPPNDQSLIY